VRNATQPTHVSTSAHSDDITSLAFHPSKPHVLLSGSTDGLLCTTDIREPNEDESGLHVGNWGCSIAKAGWTGARDGSQHDIWAHSDMQTLSTWSEEVRFPADFPVPSYPTSS
jgi:WD40 repeat protein